MPLNEATALERLRVALAVPCSVVITDYAPAQLMVRLTLHTDLLARPHCDTAVQSRRGLEWQAAQCCTVRHEGSTVIPVAQPTALV
jgi:hypothetical protein